MTLVKSVAGLIPGMQSLTLFGHTAGMATKSLGSKTWNAGKSTGNLIKGSTGVLFGIPMIGATSKMVSEL